MHTSKAQFSARPGTAESIEDILAALVSSPGTSLDADTVAIATTDVGSDQIRIHYAGTLPTELRDRYHAVAPDAPLPWTDVIAIGQPLVIADTADADPRYEAVVRDWSGSVRAAAVYPLKGSAGAVHGSLALLWSTPHLGTRRAERPHHTVRADLPRARPCARHPARTPDRHRLP
ncbi:hypothetical protein ALI144C_19950 [Actinosynnema sp. ALI-1.44]|uniref:hypothetical protein n=1 Tax=Actinosynnema sp. ALI-1.44 TaxID=1933779 RepID=UPI00097C0F58|nr:hypothetical protein [Actinosynnema sp. ALI-1.44]ONI81580.1 hypothetical protein ALI144C_19950 [Actinosynnema sp. ALI-1.44]